jgi:tryptophanyl-tRNA synthetase
MAKYFNIEKARAAGVPQEQIDAFIKQNKLAVRQPVAPQQQPMQQPEMPMPQDVRQPTFNERIGQGALNIGKTLAQPFIRTGKNIAGGLLQAPLAIRAGDLANVVNDPNASDEDKDKALKELRRVNQLNKLMAPFAETGKATDSYKQDAGQVLSDPRVTKQVRDSINVASYAVPFGKGANIATKALLPGAAVGAMQEASQDDATLSSVAGGALTGSAFSGLAYGASKIPSLIKKLGGTTEKAGQKLIQSQYNLPRNVAKSLDLPATVQKLNEYGFNGIDDVANKADEVMSIIEKPIQSSVSKAKAVDLQGLTGAVKDIVDDPSIRVGQDEKIMGFVDKLIQKMSKGGKGSELQLSGDPNSVLEVIRTLEKKAADVAKGKLPVAITDEERALKQAYRLIADELKDRLYTGAGADNLVAGEVGQVADLLKKFSPKLAEEVSKAKTVGELRSLMAPFVRGKIAAETTQFGQNLATETMGGAVKGLGKMAQNPLNLLAVPLGSDVVSAGVGGATANVGRALSNARMPINISPQVQKVAGAVAANTVPRIPSLMGDQQPQALQADQMNTQLPIMSNIDQLTTDTNKNSKDTKGATGYSYNELTKAYAKAMFDGDTKLANRIKPLIELEKEALPLSSKKTPSTSTLQMQGKAKSGIQAADVIQNLLDSDPNLSTIATVPMVDLFKGTNRKLYEAAVSSLTDAIGGLRTGATVSKDQQIFYKNMLPKPGDSPAVIKQKLDAVRREMNGYLNTELLD